MRTLVLNADFCPMDIVTWKRALLMLMGHETPSYCIEYYNQSIHDSMGRAYQLQSIVVLKDYVSMGDGKATYNKLNVYYRDKFTCQYCGRRFEKKDLTIDHVIPKSKWKILNNKGTSSCFENVVSACYPCNSKKRNRTPNEAKMPLLKQPKKLTRKQAFLNKISCYEVPEKWKVYIN